MTNKKSWAAPAAFDLFRTMRAMLLYHDHGGGLVALGGAILILSILAGARIGPGPGFYMAGEIAQRDMVADRDILLEDDKATQARREQALSIQPLVFDLDRASVELFRADMLGLLHDINTKGLDDAGLESIREDFNTRHGSELPFFTFRQIASPVVQNYILATAMPWLEGYLNEGVLPDMRQLTTTPNAVIVRDAANATEILRTQAEGLHDLRSLMVGLGQMMRSSSDLKPAAKSALLELMPLLVLPSLAINKDATALRNSEVMRAVEPVLYRVHRGEVIVRAGDRVTYEQQIKMQSLFGRRAGVSSLLTSAGTLFVALFLGLGLFMTPSGNKGKLLRTKDQNFIALLLLVFGVAAWGVTTLFRSMGGAPAATAMTFAFPVAGGAGLAALIFSARRYCGVGLLLSFFTTVMLQGDLALFLFYFLSCMVNTWLVLKAQNRQDVVWSGLPLFLWLLATGIGTAMLSRLDAGELPTLLVALGANAALSVILLFALSPFLEMLMGYTTRFRMMELMNLEHPLLKELMMTIPGTYHHSLVVSHLVEAGATAVGANSLLCKVGALYHDIGKLYRPDYFSENQFGGPNPHDKLSPAMSALVLGSHVKQGVDLAQQYKLGSEISSLIAQHHGTRAISFFFQKAQEQGENPRIEDFSYGGPRPQSSEAAVIMMADAVEAASRTLVEPTPARIRAHVEGIIKGIYAEGQLDESDLSFRDLNKLIDAFTRILTGLFHQRVAYPDRSDRPDRLGPAPRCRADKSQARQPCAAKNGSCPDKSDKPDKPCPVAPAPAAGTRETPGAPVAQDEAPPQAPGKTA